MEPESNPSIMETEMSHHGRGFFGRNWLSLTLLVLMAGVVFGMGYLMYFQPKPTPRETALEELIQTAAAIIAGTLGTKIYAEEGYSRGLRDRGVQIAGVLMMLKRQIETLAEWVVTKREGLDQGGRHSDPPSAVLEHVELTLQVFRGMTESALGGIAGVIGDALAQYDDVMDKIA